MFDNPYNSHLSILLHKYVSRVAENDGLEYKDVEMFHVFADEGSGVGDDYDISLTNCKKYCSDTSDCWSFAYCSKSDGKDIPEDKGRCHLKNKRGNKDQAISPHEDCRSYYRETLNLGKSP